MISNKKIILINIPFTLVKFELCPLEQVSMDTLRFITYLENKNNKIVFVNMRSKEKFLWKMRKSGILSQKKLQTSVATKKQSFLIENLKINQYDTDEIWLILNFSIAPYLFDIDIVKSFIKICNEYAPKIKIKIGGAFINLFPEFVQELGLQKFESNPEEFQKYEPKISLLKKENYGIFQLAKGCCNKCSFCIAGKEKLASFDIQKALDLIYEMHSSFGVKTFWNWDQNILLFSSHLISFLKGISALQSEITLNFALGFQPNLISEELIAQLSKISIGILTIPFESGTSSSFKKINKPYTIIESIKKLYQINKYAKKTIKRVQSSFIIGYPHDDFNSIFRIYLAILRLQSTPIPFPLYIFPGTKEYDDSYLYLKNKSITELHGQLWPLIEEKDVDNYQNLLQFLLINNLEKAKNNIELLSDKMKTAFYQELKINEYFVDMCLKSPDSSYSSLLEIEKKLENYKKRKEVILHISVSPKISTKSTSKYLGNYFCNQYKSKRLNVEIENIELSKEKIIFINEEYTEVIDHIKDISEVSEETKRLCTLADNYINKLRHADKIIISTPMYTLSIPAILKAFFELIASKLFYHLNESILSKDVYCIISRDGRYRYEEQYNLQEKSIEAALSFIGIGSNINFIVAEGLYISKNKNNILEDAKQHINSIIENLYKKENFYA